MSRQIFLFDTYAIIEIIRGNPNYEKYLDCGIVINEFIFAELCYQLIRLHSKNKENYLKNYSQVLKRCSPTTIEKAMKFRFKNKNKKMSMTDCISYTMALKLNIKFLTGDKEFKQMSNVEFQK